MVLQFSSSSQAHKYARDHGFVLVLEGTKAFKKGDLGPDKFQIVSVQTGKGLVKVGLFAAKKPSTASLAAIAWHARRRAEQQPR